MGDHFWPAMYPGLIVGAIYGLSAGGLWNVVLGAIAGLIGAIASNALFAALDVDTGIVTLVGMAIISLLIAAVAIRGASRLRTRPADGARAPPVRR